MAKELALCINQHLTELLSLNLRDKDILVKTIAEFVWCNVDFQCVKNLECFIKHKYSIILQRLLQKFVNSLNIKTFCL